MIKDFKNNFHIIISILVAVILIINGIIYQINEINYKKNAYIVDADIYQISKNKDTKTLYIMYEINNKEYKGAINTKNKNITLSDDIKIYCDKKNPKNYTDGTISKYGIYLIILGVVILLIDISVIIKNKLK